MLINNFTPQGKFEIDCLHSPNKIGYYRIIMQTEHLTVQWYQKSVVSTKNNNLTKFEYKVHN